MGGLAGVDEEGGTAGAGQGGGDLAADVPRLAHPQDDDAPLAAEHETAGAHEVLADALAQGGHGARLQITGRLQGRAQGLGIEPRPLHGHRAGGHVHLHLGDAGELAQGLADGRGATAALDFVSVDGLRFHVSSP